MSMIATAGARPVPFVGCGRYRGAGPGGCREGGEVVALALYRKYRPRTFAEVIGQQQVTEPLAQALRTGRLHHAYLFSGPRGCGKTSSARILARSLNCAKGPTPEPCGECESCVALAPDGPGSIDVIEIDAASHGGVDDARDLRERAFFAPVNSRFKVYVIDEAHMVSTQGFNALLKLVEEPPEYVKFVFATTEPEKVLGTIKSRTHHYPFRLIPPTVLRPYLEQLCREEGVAVEPAVFPLVVRAGGGSVRDSLSVLDQLIAGAGVYGVTYTRAVGLLGVTDVALIDEMVDALAAADGAAAFATIDRVAEAGHDTRRYTADLLERLRDLIIMQRVPDAAATGIIEAPDDQLERMTAQAARMGAATLSRLADIAHNGLTEMRGTMAPRLVLELLVARMLLPGADDSHGALLQRVERMERRLGAASGADSPPAAPVLDLESAPPVRAASPRPEPSAPAAAAMPDTSAKPAPPKDPPATADHPGALDAAAVRRVWDEVLAVVRRRSPRAWAVVREAVVRDVHDEQILLVFQHAVHASMFGAQTELLVEAVREVLGGNWHVQAELGGDERAREGGAAADPDGDDHGADGQPDAGAPGAQWPTPARPGRPVTPSPAPDGGPTDRARPVGGADRARPAADRSRGATTARGGSSRTSTGATGRGQRAGARGLPSNSEGADLTIDGDGGALADGVDPDGDPPAGAAAPSSEERAIQLLADGLGAERIGEP